MKIIRIYKKNDKASNEVSAIVKSMQKELNFVVAKAVRALSKIDNDESADYAVSVLDGMVDDNEKYVSRILLGR